VTKRKTPVKKSKKKGKRWAKKKLSPIFDPRTNRKNLDKKNERRTRRGGKKLRIITKKNRLGSPPSISRLYIPSSLHPLPCAVSSPSVESFFDVSLDLFFIFLDGKEKEEFDHYPNNSLVSFLSSFPFTTSSLCLLGLFPHVLQIQFFSQTQ
jgi:hypothetical protein